MTEILSFKDREAIEPRFSLKVRNGQGGSRVVDFYQGKEQIGFFKVYDSTAREARGRSLHEQVVEWVESFAEEKNLSKNEINSLLKEAGIALGIGEIKPKIKKERYSRFNFKFGENIDGVCQVQAFDGGELIGSFPVYDEGHLEARGHSVEDQLAIAVAGLKDE